MFKFDWLVDWPVIHVADDPRLMGNVNGPCLIRVPDWVENKLGKYYLYFAHHEGDSIRLAVSDSLDGDWQIVWPGALTLVDSGFVTDPPKPEDWHEEARHWIEMGADGDYPHIASPDVIVDDENQQIRLYYHGRLADGRQRTRVAISADGLNFTPQSEILGAPYMRIFRHHSVWYGIGFAGWLYRSVDGLTNFETERQLIQGEQRHFAVWKRDDQLVVLWSCFGDAPERIQGAVVDISAEWTQWQPRETFELHRPIRDWEGANLPNRPSKPGTNMSPVNQLRDPFIFEEEGNLYLLYSIQGEQGIGIGRLTFECDDNKLQ